MMNSRMNSVAHGRFIEEVQCMLVDQRSVIMIFILISSGLRLALHVYETNSAVPLTIH